jgi:preprotein translocase subunit SecA
MTAIYQRRRVTDSGSLSAGTPYAEQADRQENRLDSALLYTWGRVSPYLLSGLWRRQLDQLVHRVEDQEKRLIAVPDEDLRYAANALRGRLSSANGDLDNIASAFALARETSRRHAGMRHFRVQLLGGAALMAGGLPEMQTGEGKSLTALLPAIAAALSGRPVHIVTVNDYLARRDAEQFRPVYNALGLTVGVVEHGQQPQDRQRAYACDVTYCTNKELVFDYLRDRLALGTRRGRTRLLVDELFKTKLAGQSQRLLLRGLHFAIVDEADSVLIDEARTPLILTGMAAETESDAGVYEIALDFARRLVPDDDFRVLASRKETRLTARGERRMAEMTVGLQGLWAIRRAREELVQQALSALHFFRRDVQYIVADGKVQIVDEFTGRIMPDRSWERGLHQLIEAKENCAITERRHTLARITYQRFFRRYLHLCGMTGTAIETAGELRAVYALPVVRIPTNRPLRRTNLGTQIFRTAAVKWNAVVDSVNAVTRQGRPVLIGTRSVDASEHVGELLFKAGLQPVILNARQDRQEAEIVAGAGQPGRVTVATNMAGRGTDIQLHPAVREAGGLHVILTEYHESRRIDRQLYGRAGRQGDPGSYESIVALDDELFQGFAGQQLLRISTGGVRPTKKVPPIIGRALKSYSQSGAERLHGRVRRITLAEDHRWAKSLGFAKIAE